MDLSPAQDAAAEKEAENFCMAAMSHYADDGGPTTFSASSLPNNFASNAEIDYTGSIAVDDSGITTGTMTFSHSNRGNTPSPSPDRQAPLSAG